jgi:hypothetical protein
MAIGDVSSKVLFSAQLTNVDAQLSAGPSTGFKWTGSFTLANKHTSTVDVTLYRRFSGPTDRYIMYTVTIEPKKSIIVGPYVIENGVTVRGSASVTAVIDISVDGYEEQVS